MSNVVELIKALAWPAVVLTIFFIIKKPLKALLSKLNSVKFQGVEFGANQTPKGEEKLVGNQSVNFIDASIDQHPKINTQPPILSKEIQDSDPKGLKLVKGKYKFWAPQTMAQISTWMGNEVSLSDPMNDNQKIQLLKGYSEIMYFQFLCERTYDLIFGSQIELLNYLNTIPADREENLKHFFDDAVVKYGRDAFQNLNFNKYLDFLIVNGLIYGDSMNNINLTFLGKDFLRYILDAGKPVQKIY